MYYNGFVPKNQPFKSVFKLFFLVFFNIIYLKSKETRRKARKNNSIGAKKIIVKNSNRKTKKLPQRFAGKTCYQLNLRAFTPEGTLSAAKERLNFLKNAGIDIIYLCPVTAEDDDADKTAWSERQKASELNNPKNPYRVKDYFNVDSEYGNIDDLSAFIRAAHAKNMYVLLDLVYVHCGPSSRIVNDYPAFVKKDENGKYIGNHYHFPVLNYENSALRAYMISNMKFYFSLGADGFRLDYSDAVPADFWEQAARELKTDFDNALFLYEGVQPPAGFADFRYGFAEQIALYAVLNGDYPANKIGQAVLSNDIPKNATPLLRYIDNHDIITDGMPLHIGGGYEAESKRPRVKINASFSNDQIMAAHAIIETLDGLPMICTGYETGSRAPQSLFSNRFHGAMHADLTSAETPEGKAHYRWLKKLCSLRKHTPALYRGNVKNTGAADEAGKIARFERTLSRRESRNADKKNRSEISRVAVYINVSKENAFLSLGTVKGKQKILASRLTTQNEKEVTFKPFGVLIIGYRK